MNSTTPTESDAVDNVVNTAAEVQSEVDDAHARLDTVDTKLDELLAIVNRLEQCASRTEVSEETPQDTSKGAVDDDDDADDSKGDATVAPAPKKKARKSGSEPSKPDTRGYGQSKWFNR